MNTNKKPSLLQRIKAMPKRRRNILMLVIAAFTVFCCILPMSIPTDTYERSQTDVGESVALPAAPVDDPTAAPTSTQTTVPTKTAAPTATSRPTATATIAPTPTFIFFKPHGCLPSEKGEMGLVTRIVDGDTIHVEINGVDYPVRYIGMDTPETKSPNDPVEPLGPEAAKRNEELVMGKTVTLYTDTSNVDRFDRLLRYVFVGDVFVNETLVREGLAAAKAYPPDTACQDAFMVAEAKAMIDQLGMWVPVVASRSNEVPLTTSACPNGCTEQLPGCDIKGNINSEGVKIYHTPGSSSYGRTKIDPGKGERWFCTADEAVANGWRAPLN